MRSARRESLVGHSRTARQPRRIAGGIKGANALQVTGARFDHVDASTRSRIMGSVKSRHTGPELAVRRLLHGLGYRYSLHDSRLPGTPDLVFRKRKKIILVHGCFWHRHSCRQGRSSPKTRAEFWKSKFEGNKLRDRRIRAQLRRGGWGVLVVWSCQTHVT